MTDVSADKQIRLIKAIIRTSDYSHPVVLMTCKELGISPDELKPKNIEDFADKKTCSEIHELRFRHYETKRRTKLDQVAGKIIKSGTNFLKLLNKDLGPLHFQRYSLSPEQAASITKKSSKDSSVLHPLTTRELSQKKLDLQKKKLDRIIRVMGNIKEIKYQEEVKKKKIDKEFDSKQKKIDEEKIANEEKRIKKVNENKAKREEILRKKLDVNRKSGDEEFKVKIRAGNDKDRREVLHFKDSKTSISCRSVSKRTA